MPSRPSPGEMASWWQNVVKPLVETKKADLMTNHQLSARQAVAVIMGSLFRNLRGHQRSQQ